ncbi:MAG TPA: acyl carrier protein [Anaerolineae bacterium]|nr:acyl carrier protein [Anaerolineae bacterium]
MDIQAQIRDYIAQNLLFSDDGFGYPDDASFLEEGIVDSVGIMELVMFLEENFGLTVDDEDLTPDNFDSVNKLAAYIKRMSE